MDFDKVTEIMVCPVCQEVPLPPIYQCGNGHIICKVCIPVLKNCPTCRINLPSEKIRMLALEQLANSIEVRCKYWGKGCRSAYPLANTNDHLQTCIYEGINFCQQFGSQCQVHVPIVDFQQHCLAAHSKSTRTLDEIHCTVAQSAILEDLMGSCDKLVWEPCFIVSGNYVHVIHTQYVASQKLFQWRVITLKTKTLQNQGGHDEAEKMTHRVEITVESSPSPATSVDSDFPNKITWLGGNQSFSKFKEGNLPSEKDSFMKLVSKTICCLPWGHFIDYDYDFINRTHSDLDKKTPVYWRLSITISLPPIKEIKPLPKPRLSVVSIAMDKFNQDKVLRHKMDSMSLIDCHSYSKVVHSFATGNSAISENASDFSTFERICDICGMEPIQGTLFSCIACPDFDMCAPCTKRDSHPNHILIRKRFGYLRVQKVFQLRELSSQLTQVVHGGWICDGCGINITGVRYKCCMCLDVDLCENCEGQGYHDHHWCFRTTNHDKAALSAAAFLVSDTDNSNINFHRNAISRGYRLE